MNSCKIPSIYVIEQTVKSRPLTITLSGRPLLKMHRMDEKLTHIMLSRSNRLKFH